MQENKRTKAMEKQKKQKVAQAASTSALLTSYRNIKDELAFKDIIKNVQDFAAYHVKLAQDGVGFRITGSDPDTGLPKQEEVTFTPEQRTGHLDKAAGQQEILDFLARKIAKVTPKPTEEAPEDAV